MTPTRYEIRCNSALRLAPDWIVAKKAAPAKHGWLHYELRDGTIGLAKPGAWRVKQAKPVDRWLAKGGETR